MMIIHTQIRSYACGQGRRRLTASVLYEIDGYQIVIPHGTVWDGASIPRPFWALYGTPYDDGHEAAGLIHDWIYSGRCYPKVFNRKDADKIYQAVLRMHGVGWWQAAKEYFAVRLFGWRYYHKKNEIRKNQIMKTINRITIAVAIGIAIAVALGGCRMVEVENRGEDVVRLADGSPVIGTNGLAQTVSRGWTVYHNQHWMVTKADGIKATIRPQNIEFEMAGLDTTPDADGLAKVIDQATAGVANIAAKIGVAVASGGGSIGADAIAGLAKRFVAAGGDASKASVSMTDGTVTCTDGECSVSAACEDCTL